MKNYLEILDRISREYTHLKEPEITKDEKVSKKINDWLYSKYEIACDKLCIVQNHKGVLFELQSNYNQIKKMNIDLTSLEPGVFVPLPYSDKNAYDTQNHIDFKKYKPGNFETALALIGKDYKKAVDIHNNMALFEDGHYFYDSENGMIMVSKNKPDVSFKKEGVYSVDFLGSKIEIEKKTY